MPTYTYHFATTVEGMVDAGGTIIMGFDGSDGSPAAGSLKFSSAFVSGLVVGGATAGAMSWEDLGVTPGDTVTDVNITLNLKSTGTTTNTRVQARMVDGGGAALCASDPIDYKPGNTAWSAKTGTNRALSTPGSSTDTARLQLIITVPLGESAFGFAISFDEIAIAITAGPPPITVTRTVAAARIFVPSQTAVYPGAHQTPISAAVLRSLVSSVAARTVGGAHRTMVTPAVLNGTSVAAQEESVPPGGGGGGGGGTANVKCVIGSDAAGVTWQAAQAVGVGAQGAAAGVFIGHGYGVLYSRTGKVYWRYTPNADNWAAAPAEADTGLTGFVRGCVCLDCGVIVGLVWTDAKSDARAMVSYDRGAHWVQGGAVGLGSTTTDVTLVAVGDWAVCVYVAGGVILHKVSQDGGQTWA